MSWKATRRNWSRVWPVISQKRSLTCSQAPSRSTKAIPSGARSTAARKRPSRSRGGAGAGLRSSDGSFSKGGSKGSSVPPLPQSPGALEVLAPLTVRDESLLERDLQHRRDRDRHQRADDAEDRRADHEGHERRQRRDRYLPRHHPRSDEEVLHFLKDQHQHEQRPELPAGVQQRQDQRRRGAED